MEFFKWRNDFSVGHEEIDNQHKKIIALINELYDAFMRRSEDLNTEKVLVELSDYAECHFKYEEKLFAKHGFEHASEHIKEHESFKITVKDIVEQSKGNKKLLSMKITNFLQKWLVNHILVEDSKYKYLFAKN